MPTRESQQGTIVCELVVVEMCEGTIMSDTHKIVYVTFVLMDDKEKLL